MMCDNCKSKSAEIFLTQIVDGKMQKVNLCKECSKEKGIDDPTGFALADLLMGMGENTQITPSHAELPPSLGASLKEGLQKCSSCGFTLTDFKKTGRLGCSECYETFAEHLGVLLKAMHKGMVHVGKMPTKMLQREQLSSKMKNLQADLNKAVTTENYEGAAKLRDQIRDLEGRLAEK